MKPLSSTPPATWKQRYEALRWHSLEGQSVLAAPLGMVLVCRQGVASWMRQWHEEEPIGSPVVSPPLPLLQPIAVPGWQQQLTLVLAQITMSHLFI